jgi:dTDP-4-dehydrorhamnose reductase
VEIWGGIECTLNRVGTRYMDQFARSGHLKRAGDLDLIAQLGIKKLRYPVHWERVQPAGPDKWDWSFPDRQLARLEALGIEPIIGLLHHGSGPMWTHLLDPDFPKRLADYAYAVARRFPHVRDYTPVNEPLTTARFSTLYRHWYPHRADDRSFAEALLNQIEGIGRAMDAIRSVRADARLVQTEDVAKIFSTPRLAYQAAFENKRRWITFDMLLGRFDETHPLWEFFRGTGASESQMQRIARYRCQRVILGINYYVASERWLDENLSLHPPESHGGNGRQAYADIAAVRGCPERVAGIERIAQEVWDRYHVPLAITEIHLGCTREEQVRWLMEAWQAGENLRRNGVDLKAVTMWALLGAFDWNLLATAEAGIYEPGAFDVRTGSPRPTQLAKAIEHLARSHKFDHPILRETGWWGRPECRHPAASRQDVRHAGPPILIFGGAGNLGRALNRVCGARGLVCKNLSRHEADVCDIASMRRAIERHRPWAVVNASGYTLIDDAETDRERCFDINEGGAFNGASVCAAAGLPYVTISTDLVFDGLKAGPYLESDGICPLSVFGESKERGEQAVLDVYPRALVIRTSSLFDPWSTGHFAAQVLLPGGGSLVLPEGRISPTYTIDLCQALLDLLIDEEAGIWHLANVGAVTWSEFADLLFDTFCLPMRELRGEAAMARRPEQSVLGSQRGALMPSLEYALGRFAKEFQPLWRDSEACRAAGVR